MDRLSALVKELAEVNEQIWSLPDDAFAEKHHLLERRDALREQAAGYAVDADQQRATEELLSELSGLRSQLRQIEGQKIDLVSQAGGGPGEGSNMMNLGGVSLNARMMESQGGDRLQARIGVIKGVLIDRGVEIPAAN